MAVTQKFRNVDDYLATFPKDVQATLQTVRKAIKGAVPEAQETISYHMPAFAFHGRLLYFAAYKAHWSLFGVSVEIERKFAKELEPFAASKRGTLRFPLDAPVPGKLIAAIAKARAHENLERKPDRDGTERATRSTTRRSRG